MNKRCFLLLLLILILFLTISILPGCSCDEDSSAEALAKADDDDDLAAIASAEVGDNDDDDDDDTNHVLGPDGFYWKEDVYVQYVDGGEPGESGTSIEIGLDGNFYVLAEKGGVVVLYTKEAGASTWTQTYLDYLAFDCDMVMDEDGFLHVAVGAEDPEDDTPPGESQRKTQLRYLTNRSGSWETEIVESALKIAEFVAIDVDADDFAHIAYLDNYNDDLKYATNKSGQWTAEAIFTAEEVGNGVGQNPHIGIDPWGNVYVTFHPQISGFAEHGVYYGTNKSGSWEYEVVAGASIDSDMIVDDEGFVHIAHAVNMGLDNYYNLYYTTNLSGGWADEQVASYICCGWDVSLAMDGNGAIHIGFEIYIPSNSAGYATNKDGYWAATQIPGELWDGRNTSIAADHENVPHLVHIRYGDGSIKLTTPSSGIWGTDIIDYVGNDHGVLDGIFSKRKYILFEQDRIGTDLLNIAETNDEGIWQVETLDTPDYDGQYALSVDDNGFAHVAYYTGNLNYITNLKSTWVTELIRADIEYWGVSIDVDYNGVLYFTYLDEGLWYMNNNSGKWEEILIDDNGSARLIVKADQNGFIHICYVNNDSELNYATNRIGSWEITKIDEERNHYCSMALDSNNSVHIINYNSIYERLYYNTNQTGVWTKRPISDISAYFDVCVDSQDHVSIVNDCQYFHQEDGQWVGSENCVVPANFRSIQIDSEEMVHGLMSYRGGLWYVVFPRDYQ